MAVEVSRPVSSSRMTEQDLFRVSPFLADLLGEGSWRPTEESFAGSDDQDRADLPSIQDFRSDFRKKLDDPEEALQDLRRLRIRTLLAIGRADLEDRIKPHQIRARLRVLAETQVQGAWWLAEYRLRTQYVHPLIYERRNINPPLAICSLSRLGAGEPWYTTGPAPIFVHSRAARFAPALTEKDLTSARRSQKIWLPAREYFHRLARRTLSYLSVPAGAGKGFGHMAEDLPSKEASILPGPLVVLFSAFEDHFLTKRPIKERLSLLRMRFLVGQEKLGRAVEVAAREALLKTAAELGSRLSNALSAWYRERAAAEGLPLTRGGLLDIERNIRLLQFRYAPEAPDFMSASPLKALRRLAEEGVIDREQRLVLNRAYSWQWFVANRMSLLGVKNSLSWDGLSERRLDDRLGLPGAGERTIKEMAAARSLLTQLVRESRH